MHLQKKTLYKRANQSIKIISYPLDFQQQLSAKKNKENIIKMNKLTVTILLVAVAMAAGEAPFKKNFRGRFFQRQEAAPGSDYGAPPPAAPAEYGPPPTVAAEYGPPPTEGATEQEGGYQYPAPETPFEDGQGAGATETEPQNAGYLPPQSETPTEPQAERFRVKSGRTQKLRTFGGSIPVLTFVPAAEYYRLFQ